MFPHRFAFLVVLLLHALFTNVNCIKGCRFQYERQPPSVTPNGCSPYFNTGVQHVIQVSLECTVRIQINTVGSFEIRWFRRMPSGDVEDLGRGHPDTLIEQNVSYSKYHDLNFYNKVYDANDDSITGDYWCQVIDTTRGCEPLMRSNAFSLLPPMNYTQHTCAHMDAVLAVDNTSCADPVTPHILVHSVLTATSTDLSVSQSSAVTSRVTSTTLTLSSLYPSTTIISEEQRDSWAYRVIATLALLLFITIIALVILIVAVFFKKRFIYKSALSGVQSASNPMLDNPLYNIDLSNDMFTGINASTTHPTIDNHYSLAYPPEYSKLAQQTLQHTSQERPGSTLQQPQEAVLSPQDSIYDEIPETRKKRDYDELKKSQISTEEEHYDKLDHTH